MKRYKTVDDFILGFPQYNSILVKLREIALSTSLEEGVKWGAPAYMHKGKNVLGLGAFKSYVGLWFHQGALLKDHSKVLINAQEGTTKALRQWRFTSVDEIDANLIKSYIHESIQNVDAGKEIKPEKKPLIIPEELDNALKKDPDLESAFSKFSLSQKREYTDYISQAKRLETRLKRLDKVIPMIFENIGLNDKYRK